MQVLLKTTGRERDYSPHDMYGWSGRIWSNLAATMFPERGPRERKTWQ
jgi:hypothetical protein